MSAAEVDDDVRGIVLTGSGGSFCSGDDLNEAAMLDRSAFLSQIEDLQSLTRMVCSMPKPVIAAVDGPAYGGGLELAVCCDARIASEDARFACPEPAWGLTLTNGASVLLPRLVGDGWAKELTMFGRVLDAATAERIGLVTRVVASADLVGYATELVAGACTSSAVALALTKRLVGTVESFENVLSDEVDAVVKAFETDFTRRRLESFRDGTWRQGGECG